MNADIFIQKCILCTYLMTHASFYYVLRRLLYNLSTSQSNLLQVHPIATRSMNSSQFNADETCVHLE